MSVEREVYLSRYWS